MQSIIPGNINNMCHFCGRYVEIPHKHHIFGAANRKFSEKYGLWVYLCPEHHNMSKHSVHRDKEIMEEYHIKGQKAFEKWFRETKMASEDEARKEFMRIFGRNYL